MNRIAEEIKSYFGVDTSKDVKHYGRSKLDGAPGRGSGRYPLGSGEDPNQRNGDFVSRVKELKKKGMSEIDIAKAVHLSNTNELRREYTKAIHDQRAARVLQVKNALADGKKMADISKEMGIPESTLRSYLNEKTAVRANMAKTMADFLRDQVDAKGMIDVGIGVERELNCSRTKLEEALSLLEDEGYVVWGGGVPQATNPGRQTNLQVLCPKGTEHKDIYNYENIHTIQDYKVRVDDDGTERVDKGFEYPTSISSSRVQIRLRDDIRPDGHKSVECDGVIEIRRGVPDLDLGESHYAQVRILVDGDKYLKGMAIYADDLPDGVDVAFNSNKPSVDKAYKAIKKDPDNPFGALVKEDGGQYHYIDENGERKLGAINKTRMEGDWRDWEDKLPSQFLAKQSLDLITKQLNLSYTDKLAEFEEIKSLTNPTVKKKLLEDFASDCDSSAVDLKAAALPGQKYQVILPITTMKDDEIFAPNYENGTTLALIRYPHGGTFEIPILKVNNKQPDALRILGPSVQDAVGINAKVAERLSGADFDGDTAMCIPCNRPGQVHINSTPLLDGLKDFDPKLEYGYTDSKTTIERKKVTHKDGTTSFEDVEVTHYYRGDHEFKTMSNTQMEMGKVSNLITDMTLKGAPPEDLAKAVRHSMVVIDAEKHHLDWRQSEKDNEIAALKREYQLHIDEFGKEHTGASTLISLSKSPVAVLKRKGSPKIDPETGELVYKEVVEQYTDKQGKVQTRMQDSTLMAETKDARTLSSGTKQENLYADYANSLKALANEARKEILTTGKIEYSSEAKATYRAEVDQVMAQLNIALMNAPRERIAQLAAASEVKAKKQADATLTGKEIRKIAQQSLSKARTTFNAERHSIQITDRIWEAIQSGAFSESALKSILRFADPDVVRKYATPRTTMTLSPGKQNRIDAMLSSGYTIADIAKAIGVSSSTVNNYLHPKN